MIRFSINHVTTARLTYRELIELADSLECEGIQLRNDLGRPLFEGDEPESVKDAISAAGLRFLGLSEIKQFNDWNDTRRAEAARLIEIARAAGAEAVGLIPRNDGQATSVGERRENLRTALSELAPMLEAGGLVGLVEPLGFKICSLRFKAEAIDVISSLGLEERFRLVHDTFHHALSGETEIFPDNTGVLEISGADLSHVAVTDLQDDHRVLVGPADRLGNVKQIGDLRAAGYVGPISWEVFAPEIRAIDNLAPALRESMAFINDAVGG